MNFEQDFPGAEVVFGDVTSTESLKVAGFRQHVDVVVSCLASRTGGVVGFRSLYPALQ